MATGTVRAVLLATSLLAPLSGTALTTAATSPLVAVTAASAPAQAGQDGAAATAPTLRLEADTAAGLDPPTLVASGSGWPPGDTVDLYIDTEFGATWLAHASAGSGGTVNFGQVQLPTFLVAYGRNVKYCIGPKGTGVYTSKTDPEPGCAYQLNAMDTQGAGNVEQAAATFNVNTNPSSPASQQGILFPNGKTAYTVSGLASSSGCNATGSVPAATLHPQLPLGISGRWILGAQGDRFKLASVNWYGAEEADFVPSGLECQPVSEIADQLLTLGVNSVRLPWSNAMEELDPLSCTKTAGPDPAPGDPRQAGEECVPPEALAANPALIGDTALQVFEAVITALSSDGIVVILDDHSTDAAFSPSPYDGLWWSGKIWDDQYGLGKNYKARTRRWEADWVRLLSTLQGALSAGAYADIVGADLRNEPSYVPAYLGEPVAQWPPSTTPPAAPGSSCLSPASSDPTNWVAAAEEGGDAVLCEDPALLVMVEGVAYSTCFNATVSDPPGLSCKENSAFAPIVLTASSKVVYSPHSYPSDFTDTELSTYSNLRQTLGDKWGFLLKSAPVWVGEFGATASQVPDYSPVSPGDPCTGGDGPWLNCFINYLESNDADWSYWAVNGTEADGGIAGNVPPRTLLNPEPYGILNQGWDGLNDPALGNDLGLVEPPSQGPGSWTPSQAPVPANAESNPGVTLSAATCPAAGSCTAVGDYADTNGDGEGLIETLSDGTWTPTQAPVPANANVTSYPGVGLFSITCPAAGSCTAVGDYPDTNGGYQGLIETLSDGTWTPTQAPVPANAGSNPVLSLSSITCPAVGSCTAVGHYLASGDVEGLIETLSDGTWTPTQAPVPANANAGSNPVLSSITCAETGSCTAVGDYNDTNGGYQGLIETLSDGTWTPTQAPVPANAASNLGLTRGIVLLSVACPETVSCTAVGDYTDTNGDYQGLIEAQNPPRP